MSNAVRTIYLKVGLILAFIVLFESAIAQSQSISGQICTITNAQYPYVATGNFGPNTPNAITYSWSTSGGSIQGSSTGQGVNVIWPTAGSTWHINVTVNNTNTGGGNWNLQLNVTAIQPVAGGTISNPSQNINYNTLPATLTCGVATGGYCGTPTYTYQWQSSTNDVSFSNISGATSQNLSFSTNLTQTMYYRRLVTETHTSSTAYSNVGTVLVYPQLIGGTVNSSQTINYNTAPASLTLTGVSGGTNSYSYEWYNSTDNINWNPMSTITGTSFTPPALTSLTYYRVQVISNGMGANSNAATITVNPQVLGGTITPASLLITSGTSPGALNNALSASGGNCSGSYSYQWQSSSDGINFTNVTGATTNSYIPGNLTANTWYRRKVTCGTDNEYSNSAQITISTSTPDMNFVRVRSILKAGVTDSATALSLTSPYDVSQVTQYFDGLGRVVQTVSMQQSPLQKDLVSLNVYDNYEREATKYLPYPATTNDGNFKPTAQADDYNFNSVQYSGEQYYYSEINFEPSPLGRTLTSYAPGINWVGSARGLTAQYLVNQTSDSVRIWNIAYPVGSIPTTTAMYGAGSLYKNITTDEAGHQAVEYKDMTGHVVLKKVQVAASPGTAHVGWLCTYYVYDELNYLRFVIQPQAVVAINSSWSITTAIASELCFRYEYDAHRHMIIKKIPGAGETWMVYDIRDRLVMTQDSNLRSIQKWLFTRYDAENRADSTGLITDPTNYNHLTYYDTTAFKSNNFPVVSSYTNELLTTNYYDDYSWATGAGLPSTLATNNTSNTNYFYTTFNASPNYAVAITPLYITRGMMTGSMKKVIGTSSQYLYGVSFYDDRGRVIQTQSINYTGGIDSVTNQYDFSGKSLRSLLGHQKKNNTVQNHIVVTKMDYDNGFRLRHIYKNIDGAASDQLIDSMQYDELGQLRAKYLGNNVDSIVYDYNIRGWLTGINKNYVAGTTNHYFGMELGYDKTTSVANGNTYLTPEYNGNIEGTVWKSAGSGINRKYDFTYDNVNRISTAAFLQNTSGSSWDKTQIDFSVSNMSYDANGNILTMTQNGFTVGGSGAIDQLTYAYQTNSNKLSQVTDAVNNPSTLLGDFHYSGSKGSFDYTYDGNGNLNLDNNKAIDKINYNYLNLPQLVHLNTKGNITYTYDASGNKLAKLTADSTNRHATTTLYIGPFVYQQCDTITTPTGGVDTLQFIAHEEGRTRWAFHKYTTGTSAYKFEHDFFEKDHLGNTRMLLTQQKDTAQYLASMESAYRSTEVQLFGNITQTCYARASVSGYPVDHSITNPNDSVSKVDYNGTSGQKTGPNLLLKIMSGDTVKIGVQSYYNTNSITTTNSSFTDVLTSLANGLVNTTAGAHGNVSNLTTSGSSVYTGLTSFLGADDPAPPSGYPKAYLNWIFLDDQFNYVSSLSGAVPAASSTYPAGTLNTVAPGSQLIANKNGYLYVWVSNETQGWDVFFDNLSVQHRQGPVLEENHYYPFGLSMAGISDQAVKSNYATNKIRFQKQELQNKEFSDGSGIEMYEFKYRMDDPQIGRFWSIDPLSEKYVYNSTYAFSENKVTGHIELEGLEAVNPNDSKYPYVRAALKDNVQKDVKQFHQDMSQSVQVKGSVGVGFGVTVKGGPVDVKANANGPQLEGSVDGGGNVQAKGSTAGVGVTVKTPVGGGTAGANVGTVEYKDGKVTTQAGAAGANAYVSREVSGGNSSENVKASVVDATLSVGAKVGIVGVVVTVNVVKAAMSVVDFFKTGFDTVVNGVKESLPAPLQSKQ